MNEEIADPNEVVRMNNAMQGTQTAIGATFKANVYPGDKIKMEVYAKYANFEKNNLDILPTIVSYLESSFGLPTAPDGPLHIFDFMNEPWFASLPAWDDVFDDKPRAFLNYIVLDDNFQLQDFDVVQVGDEAEIPSDAAAALIHKHQKLELEVTIEKQGTIYVYLSVDDRQNMDVYFDDLKVTHELNDIVAGGDYYPFGSVMAGREITRDDYRFGYQGQFSEKDEETGWNSFEARMYDAILGRWMIPDPSREFSSVYRTGNNPINSIDPDGRDEFNVNISNQTVNNVGDKGGDQTHYYYVKRTIEFKIFGKKLFSFDQSIANYTLNANENGLVQFPEEGPNWGRFGTRDDGGDNWASPEFAGKLFGLFYDYAQMPLTTKLYYNDISAGDLRNIGHTLHRTGEDIDIRYPGSTNSDSDRWLRGDNCNVCWPTLDSNLTRYRTYNLLAKANRWGFNRNYAYFNQTPFTINRARDIHVDHLHLGFIP
jgi:RHS repeat-associated protein